MGCNDEVWRCYQVTRLRPIGCRTDGPRTSWAGGSCVHYFAFGTYLIVANAPDAIALRSKLCLCHLTRFLSKATLFAHLGPFRLAAETALCLISIENFFVA